jgi:hypothetical protein
MLQQIDNINATSSTFAVSPEVMVDVQNLVKSYNHKTVVNEVSFQSNRVKSLVCLDRMEPVKPQPLR